MKILHKFTLLSLVASLSFGAGYRISEQGGDAVATAAANVATSFGADAVYYNPANMVFIDPRHHFSVSSSWFHTQRMHFKNSSTKYGNLNYDSKSRNGDYYIPSFYLIGPYLTENLRLGLSLATPAGVGMRWDDEYPRSLSKMFYMRVVEFAPNLAYKFSDNFAIGGGVRVVYTEGKIRNQVTNFNPAPGVRIDATRELEGNTVDFGYNLALTYKPLPQWSLAATYRSKVDLTVEGDAKIKSQVTPAAYAMSPALKNFHGIYNGDVLITVPLPAVLTLATSYEWDKWTFMFAYDRTFWSSLEEFDFKYPSEVPAESMFDEPVEKNWHDTNTFRIAAAYQYSPDLRLMAGFAIDEAATKNDKIRFELPDTKSYIYSVGANYKVADNFDITGAFLYQDRQKREVAASSNIPFNNVEGSFGKARVTFVNLTLNYNF